MTEALMKRKYLHVYNIKFSWLQSCSKLTGVHEPVRRTFVKGKENSASSEPEYLSPLVIPAHTETELPLTTYPAEPIETDLPIRCPQPEPLIVHDGEIFRERAQNVPKTTGEILFLSENEVRNLLRRQHRRLNDRPIFPSASAPESSILELLD
ncbi:hypothetical protein KP509_29G006800 [Ceratopteris richardii]|uniref:Uncharacterized protein n=1 Tax=Ceratopteris richardii TaxID=49495 RepID=A0A8T2R601_CERRI|nr:hypothetical protein KP509_29G006800 [Ceratopteris richardii]KAH7291215.1 hypothetical protein KP509_29G006800 [Ceratopteris richardii]